MQYDHILIMITFGLLIHPQGLGSAGKIFANICCCIHDSLQFDMQHGHVLDKFNFVLKNPSPWVVGEGVDLLAPSPRSRGVCG